MGGQISGNSSRGKKSPKLGLKHYDWLRSKVHADLQTLRRFGGTLQSLQTLLALYIATRPLFLLLCSSLVDFVRRRGGDGQFSKNHSLSFLKLWQSLAKNICFVLVPKVPSLSSSSFKPVHGTASRRACAEKCNICPKRFLRFQKKRPLLPLFK